MNILCINKNFFGGKKMKIKKKALLFLGIAGLSALMSSPVKAYDVALEMCKETKKVSPQTLTDITNI
jgi:hypothetical protein